MVQKISSDIQVHVFPQFQPGLRNNEFADHVFSYDVFITNHSKFPVKLLRRKWEIFDANGIHKTVEGEGVVGRQPIIEPAATYKYRSAVTIISEMGRMGGYYTMIELSTMDEFDVEIPSFDLIVPYKLN